MKRCSASLQADSLPSVPPGKPNNTGVVAYPFSRWSSWPRNRTGVSCFAGRFLLAYQGSLIKVTQSCPTLCDPMDCSLPGSSVHGILQGWIMEWVAFPFSRGSSQNSDWTQVSCIAGGFFTTWATRKAQEYWSEWPVPFFRGSSWPRNWTGVSCIAGRLFTRWAIREVQVKITMRYHLTPVRMVITKSLQTTSVGGCGQKRTFIHYC